MKKKNQQINIFNDLNNALPLTNKAIKAIPLVIFKHYKIYSYSINIVAVRDETLRKMKNEHFNKNLYTDVISFLLEKNSNFIEGEIYICPKIIKENAHRYSNTFNKEFARVVIHGILHLLGYEDETEEEKKRMHNRENEFLKELNYDN
ncbi:MAG: rRNA maturation RNase YbeY [Candidatus Marinimicrobia bacterium]|nr:rRNA maturation RNase YbeY [Candidatus Neomarinimicrobiota bacterium]